MKTIIIGGVAGGASAAARLRRLDEKVQILIIEKGEYISYANCGLPYYIGDVIHEREKLFVQNAKSFSDRFNVDIMTQSEVIEIDRKNKEVTIKNLNTQHIFTEKYDKLILAPGSSAFIPPLEGINLPNIFTIRNVNDSDKIKELVITNKIKHVTIIGAGFIGLEITENFSHLGIETVLIERSNQVLSVVDYPFASLAKKALEEHNVSIKLDTSVLSFRKSESRNISIQLSNNEQLETDLVILSIGVKPNSDLAKASGINIGENGGILVNKHLQTSDSNIYSIGDVIEFISPITKSIGPTYLAGPANKQGRICATNLVSNNRHEYKGSINTAIVKIFDLTIATTGLSEKNLIKQKIPYNITNVFGGSNAGYYPGAETLLIQLAYSPENGKILGGQVAGKKGIDKRIDIISLLIQQEGTIYDLAEFEHAYAPPFSSAKDPLNMAGFASENTLLNNDSLFYWHEVEKHKTHSILLDVRTEKEFQKSHINGAINIPVDKLRNELSTLNKDKTISLYCKTGIRGYIAQRILKQNGFNASNLSGGFDLYEICQS
jgi:NADPH-dependent 2,4-dienoyl-CoA reductase/sulfur reductase-like enzyme/rhodanese-related sulfurtransferase